MKKIGIVTAMIISMVIGVKGVKAETDYAINIECSNLRLGYRTCEMKATLKEETTKVTMNYSLDQTMKITNNSYSNEEGGWKFVASTITGQSGQLTFEQLHQ